MLRPGFQFVDPAQSVPVLTRSTILPVGENPLQNVNSHTAPSLVSQTKTSSIQPHFTASPVPISQHAPGSAKAIQSQNDPGLVVDANQKNTTPSKNVQKQPLLTQDDDGPVLRSEFIPDQNQPLIPVGTGDQTKTQTQENQLAKVQTQVAGAEKVLEKQTRNLDVVKIEVPTANALSASSDVIQPGSTPVLEKQISTEVLPLPRKVLEEKQISEESKVEVKSDPNQAVETQNATPESSKVIITNEGSKPPATTTENPTPSTVSPSNCICRTKRQFYQFIQSKTSPDTGTVQCTEKGCYCACKLTAPDQDKTTSNPFSHLPEHLQKQFAVFKDWPFTQSGWGRQARLGKRSSGTVREQRSILKKNCSSKECLEGVYGPNAIPMLLHAFAISGLRLPPNLLPLANHVGSSTN
jgi:hypothetical protein